MKRWGLLGLGEIVGQVFRYLAAQELDHSAVRLLQAQVLGYGEETGFAQGVGNIQLAFGSYEVDLGISHAAAYLAVAFRFHQYLVQRTISFEAERNPLAGFQQSAHQRAGGQCTPERCRSGRICSMTAAGLIHQPGGDAGQCPDIFRFRYDSNQVVGHGFRNSFPGRQESPFAGSGRKSLPDPDSRILGENNPFAGTCQKITYSGKLSGKRLKGAVMNNSVAVHFIC
jgi:hypothetical protein